MTGSTSRERSFDDISPQGGYGDWLAVGKKTPPYLLASMYFAYCASLMQEMAQAIDKKLDVEYFGTVAAKAKQAFEKYYTDESGRLRTNPVPYGNDDGNIGGTKEFDGHTQTAYANAIYMKMLNPEYMQLIRR